MRIVEHVVEVPQEIESDQDGMTGKGRRHASGRLLIHDRPEREQIDVAAAFDFAQ